MCVLKKHSKRGHTALAMMIYSEPQLPRPQMILGLLAHVPVQCLRAVTASLIILHILHMSQLKIKLKCLVKLS